MKNFVTHAVLKARFARARLLAFKVSTCVLLMLLAVAYMKPALANGVPFKKGDIIVSVEQGYGYYWDSKLLHYSSSGALKDTIDFGTSSRFYAGMAFDASGNLYIAVSSSYDWQDGVVKVDKNGHVAGAFGSGYLAPFSITFESKGYAYVGEDAEYASSEYSSILKLDPKGVLVDQMQAKRDPTSGGGVEYMDLASDQCTMRYTGSGDSIKQFNICTNTQMPDFITQLDDPYVTDPVKYYPYELIYKLQGLKNGNLLAGTWDDVFLLSPTGGVLRNYHVDGAAFQWLSLEPGMKTFVADDWISNYVYRFDIDTGAILAQFKIPDAYRLGSLVVVPDIKTSNEELGCDCSKGGDTTAGGDPIDTATGNEYRSEVDVSLGSLGIVRHYNSDDSVISSHVGAHWRLNYDRSIEYAHGSSPTSVVMLRSDGKQLPFDLSSGQWTSDPDIADRLTEEVDANGLPTGWNYFVAATRDVEHYGAEGHLQSITDSAGQVTRFEYSTTSTPASMAPQPGLLLGVTDPQGHVLGFTYDGNARVDTITEPDGGELTYGYDGNGNLVTVTYPDHSVRKLVYNEPSLTGGTDLPHALTGEFDESGTRYASIGYDDQGRAVSSRLGVDADWTQVSYNTDGTSSVTYPNQVKVDLGFVMPHKIHYPSKVSEPCGSQCGQPNATQQYDANGYPASVTDFNGNVTKTTYDADGLLEQKTEGYGTSSQRTINLSWNTALRVPLSRMVMDASGTVVSHTAWVYNTRGQVVVKCEIDPGNPDTADYDCRPGGSLPSGVRRWTYTYCDAVDGYQCPLVGLMLSETGPRTDLSQTTTSTYYMDRASSGCGAPGGNCHQPGDLHTVTDPMGHVTTYDSYDADGRVTRVTGPNDVPTDLTYTPRGWLASRSVGRATTSFTYTPYGAVASMSDPDGVTLSYAYDAAHRLTDITDAQGNRVHYTLDSAGNKVAEQVFDSTGAMRRKTMRTFNALGELTSVIDGLDHTVFNANFSDSYDANGNRVRVANAVGTQQQMNYDALNRLVSTVDDYDGTDPSTANTQSIMAYDAVDRVTGVSDPDDLSTLYTYDGLGDRTSLQSPDTGTSTDTYDAAGNRLIHTDALGQTDTASYDALNRITAQQYTDATLDIAYHYDEPDGVTGCFGSYPVGRLTRIVKGDTTTSYCYDAHGNVVRKVQDQNGTKSVVAYGYTPGDRLKRVTYPDGTEADYVYDIVGRAQAVTLIPPDHTATTAIAAVSNIQYLPFGPITRYKLGNGQTVTRAYDADYRMTDLTSPLLNLHYARDALGNITAMGDAVGANPATESYSYDALQRLTAVTETDGSTLESYTYNKTGDRLSKTGSGQATGPYGYADGTHHLISVGTDPYTVDPNGETTSIQRNGQTLALTYNQRHRLSMVVGGAGSGSGSVQIPYNSHAANGMSHSHAGGNGNEIGHAQSPNAGRMVKTLSANEYTYNALGERIRKTAIIGTGASNIERFVYGEGSRLLSRTRTDGSRDYIWLGGMPVALVDEAGVGGTSTESYIVNDDLGTPRVVTDAGGSEIWSLVKLRNPFGEIMANGSSFDFDLRYPGQYFDSESGLAYNVYRDYDAAAGRYIESDPMGMLAGVQTYAYANDNPMRFTDPDGRCATGSTDVTCIETTLPAAASKDNVRLSSADEHLAAQRSTRSAMATHGRGHEKLKAITTDADGKSHLCNVTKPNYSASYKGWSAGGKLPAGTTAVIHSHVENSLVSTGTGDPMVPLTNELPNIAVSGDGRRDGVYEIVKGKLQFRMIHGKMRSSTERNGIRKSLNLAQRLYDSEEK